GKFPLSSFNPSNTFRTGTATFANNNFETVNIEPQLNYQRQIGRGIFSVLIGGTYRRDINKNFDITGTGYTNDGFLGSISGAGSITEAASRDILQKYVAAFGRLGYIYNNKYILNLT